MKFRELSFEWLAWFVLGLGVMALLAFVVYSFIGGLVAGIFLYYAMRPVYRWLDERSDHGDVNATIALLTVGLPIVLILLYTLMTAARQVDQFLQANQLEQYRALVQPYVDVATVTDPQWLFDLVRGNVAQLSAIAGTASVWLLRLFVVLVVAFYLLRDDQQVADWFREAFGDDHAAVTFMEAVDGDLSTIYVGNLITIAATALVAVVAFYAFDLLVSGGDLIRYPLLLGLLVGVATLIPVVGIKLVYFPYTAVLLTRSLVLGSVPLWIPVAFFALSVVVIDAVPDLFIRAYVSKGALHMGLVMLSYVLGTAAFGWYGIFFGPIVLVFSFHFLQVVLPGLVDGSVERFVTD